MKLKGLILALIVAPIVAYIISGIALWKIFEVANLNSFISVADFDSLAFGVFALTWVLIGYAGLKPDKKAQKKTKHKKPSPLEKEFTLKDVSSTFRPSFKNALLEVIVMGSGKNLHKTLKYNPDTPITFKAGEKDITVSNDNLFLSKPFMGKPKLMAIFDNDLKPVQIKEDKSGISAEILYLAKRSGALGNTLKEMFTTHMDLKKILFFIILGIVAVVIFFIIFGGIL
jgi:hypothetical protein